MSEGLTLAEAKLLTEWLKVQHLHLKQHALFRLTPAEIAERWGLDEEDILRVIGRMWDTTWKAE